MRTLLLITSLFAQVALAGLPPTSLKGQAGSKATIFNFQVPANQATKTGAVDALIETGSQNLLVNPGFEGSTVTTGWTVAGSVTAAAETTTKLFGAKSLKLTPSAVNGEVLRQVIANGSAFNESNSLGVNLEAYVYYATGTVLAPYQLCAGYILAGSFVDSQCVTLTPLDASGFQRSPSVFVPYSNQLGATTPGIRIKSTSSTSVDLYLDQVYFGPSVTLGSMPIITSRVAFTPNASVNQGLGTITSPDCYWSRIGPSMLIDCKWANGTVTGSEARIAIPDGYTTSGTPAGIHTVGTWAWTNASATAQNLLSEASKGYLTFGFQNAATGGLTKTTGTPLISSASISIQALIPILGWESTGQSVSASTSAAYWSGYHDSTCSWARTNTAYGDPTADTTCTLTQTVNTNFGTVTSALSGSDKLPGIVFTPPRTGTLLVCTPSYAAPNVTAVAASLGIQLTDGTTVLSESVETGLVSTSFQGFLTCSTYRATAGVSTTLKLQPKASAGQITIGGNGGHAIEWSMFYIDQQLPMPLLLNTVTSSSSGVEVVNRLFVTNSGTPTISKQSGSWVSSLTDNGTGDTTVNVTAGTFSDVPSCTCNALENVANPGVICTFKTISSSALRVYTAGVAPSALDRDFNIICMGPK
jgi:hypothetical protein